MRWQPLPIVGGSYRDETRPWTYQDTINYIPVAAEAPGTRSPSLLRCAPGFSLFCDTGANAPVRGLHNVEGTLFAVAGNSLFQVNTDATHTTLGRIPGVERVSMAHNQVANGNQLVIAANSAGYYYDTSASTFGQIVDDGFPGSISFDYINQFIVGIDPSRNFAFTSDLADALSYSALDEVQAESQPDKLVGQIVTHGEWWLFGERTIQPFQDTGAGTGTFQAAQNEIMEVGCASGQTICKLDNSVFWLGNDGIVYRANGYTPLRISTHAIEQQIATCNQNQAFAFTYEDRGHKVYYLTFPDGETWGYDAASGEWHRRKSYGLDRWRINSLVYWNGVWIGGDYATGKLYKLDWNTQSEDGAVLERRRVFPALADNENPLIVSGLRLIMDTGRGGVEQQPTFTDPNLLLDPNNWVDQNGLSPPAAWNGSAYVYSYAGGQPNTEWQLNPKSGVVAQAGDVVAAQVVSTGVPDYWYVNGVAGGPPYDWFAPAGSFGPNDFTTDLSAGATVFGLRPGALQNASSYTFTLTPIKSPAPPAVSVPASVDIRYSKDGARNWSDWRKLSIGETGEFTKSVEMRRFGRGRQWVFEVRITDPVKADILAASAMIEPCQS